MQIEPRYANEPAGTGIYLFIGLSLPLITCRYYFPNKQTNKQTNRRKVWPNLINWFSCEKAVKRPRPPIERRSGGRIPGTRIKYSNQLKYANEPGALLTFEPNWFKLGQGWNSPLVSAAFKVRHSIRRAQLLIKVLVSSFLMLKLDKAVNTNQSSFRCQSRRLEAAVW